MRALGQTRLHAVLLHATGLGRDDPPAGADAVDAATARRLIAIADRNAVLPLVAARRARGLGPRLPAPAEAVLAGIHAAARARNAAIVETFAAIRDRLAAADIEPLALKGVAYVLAGIHDDPGARLFGDVDLLVPPGRAEEARALLIDLGYREEDAPRASHHLPPLFPIRSGLAPARVEIHRMPRDAAFADLGPDGAEMTAAARRVSSAGGKALVPAPGHLRDHCLVHAARGGAALRESSVLLRDVADVAALVAAAPWETVPAARPALWDDPCVRRFLAIAADLTAPPFRRLDTHLVALKTRALTWPLPARTAAAAAWWLARPFRHALNP